ncbi:MAG: cyclic nucleotide-binding domain-containing protein [Myxococcota bacterium]
MPEATHAQVQRELFLRSFFSVSPPDELASLLTERMKDRLFQPGQVIYERGTLPGAMFFITHGVVELVAPGEAPWVLEDRSFIGAIDANAGQRHPRTARARTRVRAIEMHFEEYLMILEDFFDFAKSMLAQGAQRTWETSLRAAPDGVFGPSVEPTGEWLARGSLDEVQRLLVLRNSRPFERAPVQALVTLARQTREVRYHGGEVIFRAGDPNHGMMMVADGRLHVTHDAPPIDSWVGPGNFAQGVIELPGGPRRVTATAATDVVLLRIAHEDLFDAMEEHFGLARSWWVYQGRENSRARLAAARRSAREDEASPTDAVAVKT